MLRHSVGSLLIFCALATSVWAESIGPHSLPAVEFDVLDPTFQSAVITAAESDWQDTAGADVWRLSYGDFRVHAQLFPTLTRPGRGNPQCCSMFTADDAEFWVKMRGRQIPRSVNDALNSRSGKTSNPTEETGTPSVADAGVEPETEPDGPAPSAPVASPVSAESEEGGPASHFSLPDVPEPASVLLLGLGLMALARRLRRR